jgi:hypothetical protein
MGHRSFYMGRSLVLALVLAVACGGAPAASGPVPSATIPAVATYLVPAASAAPPVTPSSVASPAATPTANTVATVGASIDLHRFTRLNADSGVWTSDWREPGFAFTRLVPSWEAETPEGTWITVEAQARRASGGETAWYSLGTWAFGDATVKRATVNGQRDADARVDTDTLFASVPLSAYRLRVTLARNAGVSSPPLLRSAAAVASDDAAVRTAARSAYTGVARDLPVPQYSQEIHAGEYPQYDGGGEAWCSPTSTTMVLGHWGRGPTPADVAWVDPRYKDPGVDHAARYTYDATYRGTGNWAFNTAYAAQYGVRAFVTQLRSLAEAERFIARGIPLVVSINVPPGGLPGFLYARGTNGHLLVIRGFTANGDVIANDPAALSNGEVRRVYPRAAFERVWVGGSGGIVYVIHPADHALPERVQGATANW